MGNTANNHKKQAKTAKINRKNKNRTPTSQDVADLANVSRATVSYILNNRENARVSDETRKRVKEAAEKLGYVPHEQASALRSGRSDLVILPFFDWPYHQNSIKFLQRLALEIENLDYTVMLRFFNPGDTRSPAQKIASFHPVGVIIISEELDEQDVEILKRNGVKAIMTYDGPPDGITPSIMVDFTPVGEYAAKYLLGKGYQKIACIVPKDKRIRFIAMQRYEGVRRVLDEAGLPIIRLDMEYETADAKKIVAKWTEKTRPEAVFTYNDEYGMMLLSTLLDAGYKIPDDIALIGCDDLPASDFVRPRLSSIDMESNNQVRDIAEHFDRMIKGEVTTGLDSTMKCKIIERESS